MEVAGLRDDTARVYSMGFGQWFDALGPQGRNFICTVMGCTKAYKRDGDLQRHIFKDHS